MSAGLGKIFYEPERQGHIFGQGQNVGTNERAESTRARVKRLDLQHAVQYCTTAHKAQRVLWGHAVQQWRVLLIRVRPRL